ncbi:MAG TPA: DsbA family protein [Afifellaceae bacterium]|nr:DsbA family protein [Afifellaceae bacterium]
MVPLDELLAPTGLGDRPLGAEDAPVTVVEYASMSCPHCANFHNTTWKPFKEKYVDTGKVRFFFREFPLNTPAYAVAMIARCAPADKYHEVIGKFFEEQDQWLQSGDMYQALLDRAMPFGFTKETFDACLSNQALVDGLNEIRTKAGDQFGVSATPTFFINGVRESGALSLEEMEKRIEPLL